MPSKTINVNGFLMDFETPKVMGVINLTPDSFYEGSRMDLTEDVVKRAYQMIDEGADILDVGGYSTRPGADDISEEEESTRVVAAIESIAQAFPEIPISIDTFRVSVAEEAIKAGATMVNDISAGYLDNRMHDFVCEAKVPYIAMHMRGTPKTMTTLNHY
ncbi:MAG: dihydropteroate synthase, partial [Cyclobacteriaceae bacterium]|nr:dihydropteroate synthase [Cyclobacteriaceae bacterium HetDA_MAG_MS6]